MKQRMKESYRENLVSSSGHKPYAGSGDAPGVASSFATSFGKASAVRKATAGQVGALRRRPAIELRNPAEWMEEMAPVERDPEQADLSRTQRRNDGVSKWHVGATESPDLRNPSTRGQPPSTGSHAAGFSMSLLAAGRVLIQFPGSRASWSAAGGLGDHED